MKRQYNDQTHPGDHLRIDTDTVSLPEYMYVTIYQQSIGSTMVRLNTAQVDNLISLMAGWRKNHPSPAPLWSEPDR